MGLPCFLLFPNLIDERRFEKSSGSSFLSNPSHVSTTPSMPLKSSSVTSRVLSCRGVREESPLLFSNPPRHFSSKSNGANDEIFLFLRAATITFSAV
ncbi:hypothetical protein PMAYCL1PPCAC_10035 [Pristionchus mayeri]|uniref:Uncharacterized protein n=1 Tax=Pristionchus mayeri TaxID=1317129 RepID=A0AAN4ZMP7_9BILA|nr:hypothetical protein PMAYCL1PPCAC_10035 [Pristionchus mayeri]